MQPPSATASTSWCGSFSQVQQVATESVQWIFGCLPCVKGHHRIHPTKFEVSNGSLYVVIEAKKRLRVLHVLPDNNDASVTAKKIPQDHVDTGDYSSLDSSAGDYWFMRWNRPIRPQLQRLSCNCSFRRSQIKSPSDSKNPKQEKRSNESIETSVLQRKSDSQLLSPKKENIHVLAEKMSESILMEAVKKSSEILVVCNDSVHSPLREEKSNKGHSLNFCDTVDLGDVRLNLSGPEVHLAGYVNPVFSGSTDALDQIHGHEIHIKPCDTPCALNKNGKPFTTVDQLSYVKESQDYNANDHNHQTLEDNYSTRNSDKIDEAVLSPKDSRSDKKKHRKSCLIGTKSYLKKPLILLIHGAGSNCEIWHSLISHLANSGYECVAPDLLGHGLSSAPDTSSYYSFHSFLQDLLSIFDRFVTEGRTAVVLGHGYGCSLAAAIARYRPEQVVQLVLISGGGPTPLAPRTPPSVSPCLRACLEPLLMCGFKRDVVYSVCGKQMEPCSPETSALPRHIVEYIAQGHVWPEGDAAFHRRIAAPTLLVHGMKDQHITLVQECEMERTIPRSFLEVIPEAGHWAMLETPNHLSHMISCFIDWWAPPNRIR